MQNLTAYLQRQNEATVRTIHVWMVCMYKCTVCVSVNVCTSVWYILSLIYSIFDYVLVCMCLLLPHALPTPINSTMIEMPELIITSYGDLISMKSNDLSVCCNYVQYAL